MIVRCTGFFLLLVCLLANPLVHAQAWDLKGHVKYRFSFNHYDDDAWFTQLDAKETRDHFTDLRLMTANRWDAWDANIHYQLIGLSSDTLNAAQMSPQPVSLFTPGVASDKSQLFDLTHIFISSAFLTNVLNWQAISF